MDQVGVAGQSHASAALPPGYRPGTHCIGGSMSRRICLDGRGESPPPPQTGFAQAISSPSTCWTIPANFVSWYSFVSGLCLRSGEMLGVAYCIRLFVYHCWRHSLNFMILCTLLCLQDKLLYCPPIDPLVFRPISSLACLSTKLLHARAFIFSHIRAKFPAYLSSFYHPHNASVFVVSV